MIFEEALKAVRSKEAIAFRSSWEGHKFIFCQIPATISANMILNMQSLPDIVKNEILKKDYAIINYINQICVFKNGHMEKICLLQIGKLLVIRFLVKIKLIL
jgi:hypothetical protein